MMAIDGRFSPFQDGALIDHLSLKEVNCISHYHSGPGQWITLLRNSPPLAVTSNCTVHLKMRDTIVEDESITKSQTSGRGLGSTTTTNQARSSPIGTQSNPKRRHDDEEILFPFKRKRTSASEVSFPLPPTPTPVFRGFKTEDTEFVGERPARITSFPAYREKEMDDRLKWISESGEPRGLETRFSMVFNCPFVSSTFHYHQRIWRILRQRDLVGERGVCRLWKDCVALAAPFIQQSKKNGSGSQDMTDVHSSESATLGSPSGASSKEIIEID